MEIAAKIDSRLVPECFAAAGMEEREMPSLRWKLGELICARTPSPVTLHLAFKSEQGPKFADATLALLWDGIEVRISSDHAAAIAPFLEKYSQTFDEAIQQKLKFITGHALLELNEKMRQAGLSLDDIHRGIKPIDAAAAQVLMEFYSSSIDRVIQEEIVGLLTKPVKEKSVRVVLGLFLATQFGVPAKRVQRFNICQALENLATQELGEKLGELARDPRFDSLRGRLCMALAKSAHPRAAETIAVVLESGDDETKVWAIEALGALKAVEFSEKIRAYTTFESADKEWTRAINKAAGKALKKIAK